MTLEDKSGRWERNRNYALGQSISVKFRDLIDRKSSSEHYVSVDWGTHKVVSKIVRKTIKRWHQYIKCYKMVSRLKNKSK